jgi:uncharacterized membrane protein
MNILQDFKERFLNFETVKGVYLLPAGGVICYVTLFYLKYVIQAFCLTLGVYMMVEGFKKIQVNRVKQKIATEGLVEKRLRSIEIEQPAKAFKESLKETADDLPPAA